MADVICNTSPIQYLHQVGSLTSIPALVGPVLIPPAVNAELAVGRSLGLNLPDPATLGLGDCPASSPPSPGFPTQGLDAGEAGEYTRWPWSPATRS